jgi:hypothetical protein
MNLEDISFRKNMPLNNRIKLKEYISQLPDGAIEGAGEKVRLYLAEIENSDHTLKGVVIYPSDKMNLSFINVKIPEWAKNIQIQRSSGPTGPTRVDFENSDGVSYLIDFDKPFHY